MPHCLILKPQIILLKKVGTILSKIEEIGCEVEDVFALDLIREDLYNFFEQQIKIPSEVEVQAFLGGISIVIALAEWEDLTSLVKTFPVYISKNPEQGLVDCRFWFGSQYKT